jgi:hypothetical protein
MYTVTICVDFDLGSNKYNYILKKLTLSPPREFSRTAVDKLALPYRRSIFLSCIYRESYPHPICNKLYVDSYGKS